MKIGKLEIPDRKSPPIANTAKGGALSSSIVLYGDLSLETWEKRDLCRGVGLL